MVLKMKIKSYKIFLIFFTFSLLFSCENEELLRDISFIDCNQCTAEEPFTAEIRIKLTDPYKFGSADEMILIDIFEGNLEDDVIFSSFQTSSNETSISLPINKKYTITAAYYINNKTYIAVNSVTPRVKYNESSCDEPCYYTTPASLNLKLKHTK